MIEIGKVNNLRVKTQLDFGYKLDGNEKGDILLPIRYAPKGLKVGNTIDVFIYNDSENLMATTEKPYAQVGEFALLRTAIVNEYGAFMDWGLPKNVLVPFSEQKVKIELDRSYIVYIYLDDLSQRVAASARLSNYLDNVPPQYKYNEEVDIMIQSKVDLGYKVIINNLHSGMLYDNELFEQLHVGQKTKAYIKKIREDEKIDLSLYKPGYEKIDDMAQKVFDIIEQHGGFLGVTDKSSPELISNYFNISKKNFKKSIGSLYKNKLITIEEDGIKCVN